MSFKSDQKFFDLYSLTIGILVLITVGIYILASNMSEQTQRVYTLEGNEYQEQIAQRLAPIGQVYMPGEAEAAAALMVAEAQPAEPAAAALTGPQVYNEACITCHGAGIGGAPLLSDSANWAPRIDQGMDVLRQHAIDGYSGSAGFMPPKGGRLDLSDQEIYDAIDFMLGEVP